MPPADPFRTHLLLFIMPDGVFLLSWYRNLHYIVPLKNVSPRIFDSLTLHQQIMAEVTDGTPLQPVVDKKSQSTFLLVGWSPEATYQKFYCGALEDDIKEAPYSPVISR